jgi:drug/metabolite transporter (DMT)-like permease
LLPLGAALAYAASLIATKKLTGTQSTMAIVFWMNLMQLPMGLAGSDPLFFMKLGQHEILPVIGIAIAGTSAHFCLANAFRSGDASVVVPLDFLRIPLIALVGWWLYGEPVDAIVFLGAGVIIAGVLWNLRDESRRR